MYKKYQGNLVPKKKTPHKFLNMISLIFVAHFLGDMLSVLLSYTITHQLRFDLFEGSNAYRSIYYDQAFFYSACFSVVLFFLYAFFGMYDGYKKICRTKILKKALICNAIMIGLVAIGLYFTRKSWHMRSFFTLVFCINIISTVFIRYVINKIILYIRKKTGRLTHPCLLIGDNDKAKRFDELLTNRSNKCLFKIVDRMPTPTSEDDWKLISDKVSSGQFSVVMYIDENIINDMLVRILRICVDGNVALKVLAPQFLRFHNPFSFGDYIDGIPLVHFSSHHFSNRFKPFRSLASRIIGLFGVIVASPILLFGFLVVKLFSKGPSLFVQERCGYNCKPFRMYKFRTMHVGADKLVEKLREKNESDGGLFKLKKDPRIFPMGGFLRKFSIDELPQLFNVIKGEMRLVGPRPLPMTDLKYFVSDWHYLRHISVPGLTCIWQVAGRSNIKFEEMCMLDIWYSLNKNWIMDIKLVFLTICTVLFDRGAF